MSPPREPGSATSLARRPAPAPTDAEAIERLVRDLRQALKAAADPRRAPGMRAYMRSDMPYLGVAAPEVHRITHQLAEGIDFPAFDPWEATVRAVWFGARHREERYAAIDLSGCRAARAFQEPRALDLYEELIVSGAWWDYVDELAVRRVGPILRGYPRVAAARLRRWSRSKDLWLRRSAIIAQVGSKTALDTELLEACIEPALGSTEFFLRKGIGWALRQHARVDPDFVRAYVSEHSDRLSPLSRREALRRIGPGPSPVPR